MAFERLVEMLHAASVEAVFIRASTGATRLMHAKPCDQTVGCYEKKIRQISDQHHGYEIAESAQSNAFAFHVRRKLIIGCWFWFSS